MQVLAMAICLAGPREVTTAVASAALHAHMMASFFPINLIWGITVVDPRSPWRLVKCAETHQNLPLYLREMSGQ
jgi:hypothetical protein